MLVTTLAVATFVLYAISAVLYAVEVFIKRRALVWQGTALGLTLVGIIFLCLVFGGPALESLRGHEAREATAYWPELLFILLSLLLRFAIYFALFVVPAVTLSDEEYLSDAAVEERANDHTAVFLAYVTFAGALSTWLASRFTESGGWRIAQLLVLLGAYFLTFFIQDLRDMLITLAGEIQLAFALMLNGLYIAILKVVEAIVWLERKRRRDSDESPLIERLERRIHDAQLRNATRQTNARQRLRERTLS